MGASVQPDPVQDYLRAKQARDSGASDPVAEYLAAKAQRSAPAQKPDGPGFISRGLSNLASGAAHAVMHPIDTAEEMLVAPVKSAFTAAVAPGVGEARPDPRLSKGGNSSGRAIDTSPYDAAHGGVTPKERTTAGIQTAVNIAAPAAFGPIASAVPRFGKTAALALTGAASGAAYNPDDPAAGAVAGGVGAAATGALLRGAAATYNKGRDLATKASRIKKAPTPGAAVVAENKATTTANKENYGQAAEEGQQAGGSSPALQTALEHKAVAPFVEMVRDAAGESIDDATTARKVYKLMSRESRGLKDYMVRNGYDAAKDLRIEALSKGMKQLKDATAAASQKPAVTMDVAPEVFEAEAKVTPGRESMAGPVSDKNLSQYTGAPNPNAPGDVTRVKPRALEGPGGPQFQMRAQPDKVTPGVRIETPGMRVQTAPAEDVPPVMPSFPKAVAERARMAQNREAFNTAKDATGRVMRDTRVAAKRLDTKSPEAFMEQILGMTPEQAQHALTGTLGAAKQEVGFKVPHRVPVVGAITKNVTRLNRISPYIDALDRQAGNAVRTPLSVDEILNYIGLGASPFVKPSP